MKYRAVLKTITWRILAVTGTIIIALIFTGSIEISLGIGSVDVIVKTIMYFLHEKVWDRAESPIEGEL